MDIAIDMGMDMDMDMGMYMDMYIYMAGGGPALHLQASKADMDMIWK